MMNLNLRNELVMKGLSNRESEVACFVTAGLSNKEVANQLFVTEKTIKFHLTQIFEKLNIKKTSEYRSKRVELITYCSKLTKEGN